MKRSFARAALLLAGFVALGLAVAGCGDSEGNAQQESLTKAEFVREAKEICKTTRKLNIAKAQRLYTEAQERGESPQALSVLGVRALLVPSLRVQTEKVRQLGTPPGDQREIGAILTEVERVLDEAYEDPERYLRELGNYERPFEDAHHMAKAYGIQACAWA